MPEGISGKLLAQLLRTERPDLRVIFSSGYNSELSSADADADSEEFFLPKPYHPNQLAEAVRQCLDSFANRPCPAWDGDNGTGAFQKESAFAL
jgi:CheY-like chemotaxis protein